MQQIIVEVFQPQIGDTATSREIREIALGAIALYNGLQMLKVLGYRDEELETSWARTVSSIVKQEVRKFRRDSRRDDVELLPHSSA